MSHEVPVAAGRGQSVSVADILNRQVPLDWSEAVAIVAGLCSALGEQPAAAMPALEDIHLTPAGTIALGAPGRHADDAVLRLLHECLRRGAQPPALRLFVLNALSSDRYRSPASLEQELAYYERPARADIIRSVRARCLGGSESRAADPKGASNFEADKAAQARSADGGSTRRRRLRLAVGVTAGAVCVTAVVALVYSHKLSGANIGNMQDLAGYVTETGRGLVSAVTKKLNLTAEVPTVPVTAEVTSGPAKKARRARASLTSASSGQTPSIGETIATADNKAIPAVADETLATRSDTVEAALTVAPDAAPTNAGDNVETNENLPPRLVDPVRLPKWANIATTRSSHLIELNINETGKVDRVRLVSPAVRMTDMMMLSAAKTWTFEPALQNGHPTPYTLTLNVAPTP